MAQFPVDAVAELEDVLYRRDIVRLTLVQQLLLDSVCAGLANAPHFQMPEIGRAFRLLLEKTILFLTDRYDLSRIMANPVAQYIFERDDGKPGTRELALQRDYFASLHGSELSRHVEAERIEIAGGRVDVLIQFDRFRFVVELKRETSDTSREGLRQYLGQAVFYQSTDAKLGLLLVLDLTEKPSGPRDMEKAVWVDRSRPTPESDWRYVVVFLVPGNRPAPSAALTAESTTPAPQPARPGNPNKTGRRKNGR